MTPRELLTAARELLRRPGAATAGIWPRAVAVLARQALEEAIDALWEADPLTSGLTRCTMRSQLACLPAYTDSHTARQVAYAWIALSNACHYHPYELAPTAAELTGWIETVDLLIAAIGQEQRSHGEAEVNHP